MTDSAIKAVIFDWDGTLMDSISQIVDSLLYAAQQYHLPLTPSQAQQVIGLALPESMRVLFPAHPHLHLDLAQTYSDHHCQKPPNDPLFEGVPTLLQQIHNNGVQMAVATSKPRPALARFLPDSGIAHFFSTTVTADEAKSKPDPLMLQMILERLKIMPEQALMVGDTFYDLKMAQQLGMPAIGVTYGAHSTHQLAQANPVKIVHSVPELGQQLLNMIRLPKSA